MLAEAGIWPPCSSKFLLAFCLNDFLHCLNLSVLELIQYIRLAWNLEICQHLPSETNEATSPNRTTPCEPLGAVSIQTITDLLDSHLLSSLLEFSLLLRR